MSAGGPRARLHLLALVGVFVGLAPATVGAQEAPLRGFLHAVWDGAPTPDNPDGLLFWVVPPRGPAVRLAVPPARRDELVGLVGSRVEVAVEPPAGGGAAPSARLPSLRVLERPAGRSPGRVAAPAPRGRRAAPAPGAAAVEPAPFLTLMCAFADSPTRPFGRAQVERMVGPAYAGAGDYYAELSGDPAVMAGNAVVDWVPLPKPRSAYVQGETTQFADLVRDCTAAADGQVDFPAWEGVNLQFSGALSTRSTPPYDTLSFGGSWTLSLDGVTRAYGMTWLSSNHVANHVVYLHEMGHALGWPHSSGDYGQEYDSAWDLMSRGYLRHTPAYGWLPIHTIMPHKSSRGWIAPDRKWLPPVGEIATGTIVRSALPPADTGWLMAEIPVSEGVVYTVEARQVAGYDEPLPAEAVLIHRVVGNRAYVVDPDLDGDPNDEGAAWIPGETFRDESIALAVTVEEETGLGFRVTVSRGGDPLVVAGDSVLATGVRGVPYSDSLEATGGLGPVTWAAAEGSLPPGVRLGMGGGLTGTPGSAGEFRFVARATSGGQVATAPYRITVWNPVTITTPSPLPAAVAGTPYADTLQASGGPGPVAWRLVEGALPDGFALDAAGVLTGTPADTGSYAFVAEAVSGPLAAQDTFELAVTTPLVVVSDSLRPPAVMGAAYADTLRATGGTGAQWHLAGAGFPPGLALAPSGAVSGVPTRAGSFTFTAVAGSSGQSVARSFAVVVGKPTLAEAAVRDALLGGGALGPDEVRFLDLLGNGNGRLDVGDVRAWLDDRGSAGSGGGG